MPPARMRAEAAPRLAVVADAGHDAFGLYKAILVARRYDVEQAFTGPEALAAIFAASPDLVIVDTDLPIIDGYALCDLLRRNPQTHRIPIIVATSDSAVTAVVRARRAGATCVLLKPWRSDTLRDELGRIEDAASTTSPLVLPALRCPSCDGLLSFTARHLGGANANRREQWDEFECATGCGAYEYRRRTRSLKRIP